MRETCPSHESSCDAWDTTMLTSLISNEFIKTNWAFGWHCHLKSCFSGLGYCNSLANECTSNRGLNMYVQIEINILNYCIRLKTQISLLACKYIFAFTETPAVNYFYRLFQERSGLKYNTEYHQHHEMKNVQNGFLKRPPPIIISSLLQSEICRNGWISGNKTETHGEILNTNVPS